MTDLLRATLSGPPLPHELFPFYVKSYRKAQPNVLTAAAAAKEATIIWFTIANSARVCAGATRGEFFWLACPSSPRTTPCGSAHKPAPPARPIPFVHKKHSPVTCFPSSHLLKRLFRLDSRGEQYFTRSRSYSDCKSTHTDSLCGGRDVQILTARVSSCGVGEELHSPPLHASQRVECIRTCPYSDIMFGVRVLVHFFERAEKPTAH